MLAVTVAPSTPYASILNHLPAVVTAIGALGTAAFGLVDTFKALPGGGISRAGFKFIKAAIVTLTPPDSFFDSSELSREAILRTLMSQWINGTASADQVSIAKSLIKLRLSATTAPLLAKATAVDPAILTQVAINVVTSVPLTPPQIDAFGRFDLLLTTLLDQAYQRADQRYRTVAKAAAVPVSVVLAMLAVPVVVKDPNLGVFLQALIVGLLATPIAPIAKNLATAITSGVDAIKALKA